MCRIISGIIIIASLLNLNGQGVVINELMSVNETTLADSEGDYPDWIEIYNCSSEAIDLQGYGLSDDPSMPRKWSFPQITLSSESYLLIFASGKDMTVQEEFHTNFKISGDGEELILSDEKGTVIDIVAPQNLEADKVFGRLPDGGEQWTGMLSPTPGKVNTEWNELWASHPGGFYSEPFKLSLYSANGDSIRFRMDGREPGPEDDLYTNALKVSAGSSMPAFLSGIPSSPPQSEINYKAWEAPAQPVDMIQIIRFASFRDGKRTSDINSASYLVNKTIENRYSMPVISLQSDPDNFTRHDSGIYVPGVHFEKANPQWTGNYFQSGREWEKQVHIEYFNREGTPGFSLNAGVRIHGMMTRQAAQKTLRIYAREEYGKKEISYPLFPRRTNTFYKRILLRSSMCSWIGNTIISDVVAQNIAHGLNLEGQEYNPTVVYLNGEYWGIHTLRDRIDERYIAYLSGEDKDSVDLINGNYTLVDAGSNEHYTELANYIDDHDLSVDEYYNHVAERVDLGSLIDYMITEIFFANQDWPGNNQKCWRPQSSDGKWRWILFDMDAGFGKPDRDLLEQFITGTMELDWKKTDIGTYLLTKLLRNQEFTELFVARFTELLNNDLNREITTLKLQEVIELYSDELPFHIQRWNYPGSISEWKSDIYDDIFSFLQRRPCYLARQLNQYFDAGIEIECQAEPGESNNLQVLPNPNNGIFGIRNTSDQVFFGRALMCSAEGKIVSVEEQIYIPAYEETRLEYPGLGSGVYFLYLVNEFQVERHRVLILN